MLAKVIASCIVLLAVASVAIAQNEITEANPLCLGWGACSTRNPVGSSNVNFLCENETLNACRDFHLLPTFVSSITRTALPNGFAGSETTIDVLIGSNSIIGLWWTGLIPEGCRAVQGLSTVEGPAGGLCGNLFNGPLITNQVATPNTGANPLPNRIRVYSFTVVAQLQPLTSGTRYYGMHLMLRTEGTLADCDPTFDPTPVCTDGCTTPACFVLNDLTIYMERAFDPAIPDIIYYNHDGTSRNYCTWQGGTGGNCPGATPNKTTTWGAVKALYR